MYVWINGEIGRIMASRHNFRKSYTKPRCQCDFVELAINQNIHLMRVIYNTIAIGISYQTIIVGYLDCQHTTIKIPCNHYNRSISATTKKKSLQFEISILDHDLTNIFILCQIIFQWYTQNTNRLILIQLLKFVDCGN